MISVPSAFARAFAQLGDRRVLGVLAKSLAVTLAIVTALAFAIVEGGRLAADRWIGESGDTYYLVAGVLALVAVWLLFRIVALAVLQFFADDVVHAVEARHYPQEAASARDIPFAEEARNALRGLLRAVAVNALALPFAIALLVTGVGTALLFWAVNAWLLGRELMDMASLRHRHDASAAPPLGALTRFALGGIVAAMLLIPFANLLAPVLGAAAATHLVHSRRSRS